MFVFAAGCIVKVVLRVCVGDRNAVTWDLGLENGWHVDIEQHCMWQRQKGIIAINGNTRKVPKKITALCPVFYEQPLSTESQQAWSGMTSVIIATELKQKTLIFINVTLTTTFTAMWWQKVILFWKVVCLCMLRVSGSETWGAWSGWFV